MADCDTPSPRSRSCSTRTRAARTACSCSNPPRTASRSGVTHFWAADRRRSSRRAARRSRSPSKTPRRGSYAASGDPFAELETLPVPLPARARRRRTHPPFLGGAVGYLGYDAVRFFEGTVPPPARRTRPAGHALPRHGHADRVRPPFPAAARAGQRVHRGARPRRGVRRGARKLGRLVRRLRAPSHLRPGLVYPELPARARARQQHHARRVRGAVSRGQEHIRAGDIFQFVPSQRFRRPTTGDALSVYRALRFINPSPYMFLFRFGNRFSLVGSSPEVHVRAMDGTVEIRPIAGTRRRGETPQEDERSRRIAAGRSQGTRRTPDARRPGAQRRGPGRGVRQRAGDGFHDHRALQPRHAHRFQRGRASCGPATTRST